MIGAFFHFFNLISDKETGLTAFSKDLAKILCMPHEKQPKIALLPVLSKISSDGPLSGFLEHYSAINQCVESMIATHTDVLTWVEFRTYRCSYLGGIQYLFGER